MDKGYIHFARLFHIQEALTYFVTRAKDNLAFDRVYSRPVDKETGLRCDQTIKLTTPKSAKDYPKHLKRVKYYDKELSKTFVFLTNNFDITPLDVALLYKNRWKVELFLNG